MSDYWSLATHGDPLGTVRDFIRKVWHATNLDGMLVTMSGTDEIDAIPQFITQVSTVDQINPFKPLMEINAARLIPGLIADHPESKIGTLLRPCELRALIEMNKHSSFKVDNLLTISVDCLGTLPADEYQWRLERKGKNLPDQEAGNTEPADNLANEALKFARQGGIVPYRYRSACQVCTSPAAEHADINIHILGLPVRQQVLVFVSDPALELSLHIETLVDGNADQAADVESVIGQLENCGECQNCLNVCPICSVDRPERSPDGHYDRSDVMRWLVSCAGCGMCEQSCPNHLPVSTIFAHIRQQLDQEWDYVPGRSMDEALPSI